MLLVALQWLGVTRGRKFLHDIETQTRRETYLLNKSAADLGEKLWISDNA